MGFAVLYSELVTDPLIYGLVDPNTPEIIRYVGQTADPWMRYRNHLSASSHSPLNKWIRSLNAQGRTPAMLLLERCSLADLTSKEHFWLNHFREAGQADLNRGIPSVAHRPFSVGGVLADRPEAA